MARRPSPQTVAVLHILAADPAAWRYGYELGQEVGLKAGALYPILMRLSDRGLLDSSWELDPPVGRPARHLYRLTAAGVRAAAEHPATALHREAARDHAASSRTASDHAGSDRAASDRSASSRAASDRFAPRPRSAW